MLVVLYPQLEQLDDYRYAPIHSRIRAAVEGAGLPLLDLWPRFAEVDPDGKAWWALPWDGHPGARAHRLAGERVADALKELELLPVPP